MSLLVSSHSYVIPAVFGSCFRMLAVNFCVRFVCSLISSDCSHLYISFFCVMSSSSDNFRCLSVSLVDGKRGFHWKSVHVSCGPIKISVFLLFVLFFQYCFVLCKSRYFCSGLFVKKNQIIRSLKMIKKTGSWKSVGLVSHNQHASYCNKESLSSWKWHQCVCCAEQMTEVMPKLAWHQCVCCAEQMTEVMPKLAKSDISVFVVQSKWWRWCPNWPKVTSVCLLCRANDRGDAQTGQKWHQCVCCAEQMTEVMPKLAKSDISVFVVQSKWQRWHPNWPKVTSVCLLCRANDWGDAQIGQKWHQCVCCAEQMTEVKPKSAKRSQKSRKVKAKSAASTSMDVDEDVDKQDEGE